MKEVFLILIVKMIKEFTLCNNIILYYYYVSANGSNDIGKWVIDKRVGEHIETKIGGDKFSIIYNDTGESLSVCSMYESDDKSWSTMKHLKSLN